ncbi:unnamed protein product, partial [Didymodactylos carnosus]
MDTRTSDDIPRVKELFIFPIKSCGGVKVQEALTTKFGLALPSNPQLSDRRWMVIKNGRHQTQRVIPRMALIQPSFVTDGILLHALDKQQHLVAGLHLVIQLGHNDAHRIGFRQ